MSLVKGYSWAVVEFVWWCLFCCHHRHVSRVFTIGGSTYQVCVECGTRFEYSVETMQRSARRRRGR